MITRFAKSATILIALVSTAGCLPKPVSQVKALGDNCGAIQAASVNGQNLCFDDYVTLPYSTYIEIRNVNPHARISYMVEPGPNANLGGQGASLKLDDSGIVPQFSFDAVTASTGALRLDGSVSYTSPADFNIQTDPDTDGALVALVAHYVN